MRKGVRIIHSDDDWLSRNDIVFSLRILLNYLATYMACLSCFAARRVASPRLLPYAAETPTRLLHDGSGRAIEVADPWRFRFGTHGQCSCPRPALRFRYFFELRNPADVDLIRHLTICNVYVHTATLHTCSAFGVRRMGYVVIHSSKGRGRKAS